MLLPNERSRLRRYAAARAASLTASTGSSTNRVNSCSSAVFLSSYARRVHMAVRSSGLDASMSRYLIDRITATPNIDLRVRTAVTGLSGTADGILESVDLTGREGCDIRK